MTTDNDDNDMEGFLQTLRMGGIEGSSIRDDDVWMLEPIESERVHVRTRIRYLTGELESLRDRLRRLESAESERPVSHR